MTNPTLAERAKELLAKVPSELRVLHGEHGSYEIWGRSPQGTGFVVCSRSTWEHRADMSRAFGELFANAPDLAAEVIRLTAECERLTRLESAACKRLAEYNSDLQAAERKLAEIYESAITRHTYIDSNNLVDKLEASLKRVATIAQPTPTEAEGGKNG